MSVNVGEKGGWLFSDRKLIYRAGYKQICKAAAAVRLSFNGAEILVDNFPVEINS